jgi:hypothetical protein
MQLTIACSRQAVGDSNRNRMGWVVQNTESVIQIWAIQFRFRLQFIPNTAERTFFGKLGPSRPGLLRRLAAIPLLQAAAADPGIPGTRRNTTGDGHGGRQVPRRDGLRQGVSASSSTCSSHSHPCSTACGSLLRPD